VLKRGAITPASRSPEVHQPEIKTPHPFLAEVMSGARFWLTASKHTRKERKMVGGKNEENSDSHESYICYICRS